MNIRSCVVLDGCYIRVIMNDFMIKRTNEINSDIIYTLGYDANSGSQAIEDNTTPATETINNSNNTTKNSTIHT